MMTTANIVCLAIFAVNIVLSADTQNVTGSKVLSRRKRFVIFPTGSSFSVAVCMTVGVYGNPQFSIFSWGLNYGFAYNLPSNASYFLHPPEDILDFPFFKDDTTTTTTTTTTTPVPETTVLDHDHDDDHDHSETSDSSSSRRQYLTYYQPQFETKPMTQRRYRRDMYKNIESVIDRMGYDGRDCVLHSLCESSQIFNKKRKTMVQELIKTVFSFPKSKVLPFEHPELLIYDEAQRKGRNKVDCNKTYSKCGFSLLSVLLNLRPEKL